MARCAPCSTLQARMRLDFHMHTELSDGALPPAQLHAQVRAAGVTHWAVTDHDTLAGWGALAGSPGLVPGVEITAEGPGMECHIVGLGVDPGDCGLEDLLARIRATRCRRLERLIDLVGLGDVLPVADLGRGVARTLTRDHLARALVARGRCGSTREAFEHLIGDARVAGLALERYPEPEEVCAAVHAAGGIAILAHPGVYRAIGTVAALVARGCDGLETRHPQLDPGLQAQIDELVAERGLLASCGSDFHRAGWRNVGMCQLDERLAQRLLARLADCAGRPHDAAAR